MFDLLAHFISGIPTRNSFPCLPGLNNTIGKYSRKAKLFKSGKGFSDASVKIVRTVLFDL